MKGVPNMAGKSRWKKIKRGPNKGRTVRVKSTRGGNFYPVRKRGKIVAKGGNIGKSRKLAKGRKGGGRRRRRRR
jgi:hypothetical protein